jgi:hypothetical protein
MRLLVPLFLVQYTSVLQSVLTLSAIKRRNHIPGKCLGCKNFGHSHLEIVYLLSFKIGITTSDEKTVRRQPVSVVTIRIRLSNRLGFCPLISIVIS